MLSASGAGSIVLTIDKPKTLKGKIAENMLITIHFQIQEEKNKNIGKSVKLISVFRLFL